MRPARKLEPTTPTKVSKPPSPAGCQPDVHPQQTTFEFHDLTFDSCFDSGNMSLAEKASDTHVLLFVIHIANGVVSYLDSSRLLWHSKRE